MSVRRNATGDFDAPTVLFKSPLINPSPSLDQFDVTADGQRFLFLVVQEESAPEPITVVVNWQQALPRQ